MTSSISTLARFAFGPPPEVRCPAALWRAGMAELRKRTLGSQRESGAFLLGTRTERKRIIREFVYYDDIDPHCLDTGIVVIDGRRLGQLWAHCRETGQDVVADVHLHPGGYQQSGSDRANPIMAEVGHIAMIIPNYATGATDPGKIGIYEYQGGKVWRDRSREAPSPLHVGWWPRWR